MAINVDYTQKFRSDYEDILESRRNQSDLRWVAREWEPDAIYKYQKEVTNKELFTKIKTSPRVQAAITEEISKGSKEKKIKKKVDRMLDEMGHSLDIGTIRKFGVILPKIMKAIYQKIYVNRSGIQKLKQEIPETPVIFLPTHRSYADFLLISYIAFHYNLPFPVIAAGMDFMSMALVGDMLRGAGAFYIKRSFMNDQLYSAVFKEYVQTIFCTSGHPVEFFLEGTRSRSGKSLPPKLGLLSSIVQCWITGLVPDVCIVPISISYNRTLEETLYAYEMLGVPKPPESTSALFKAMYILKENFGNIYCDIGEPISLNQFLAPKIPRHATACQPPHLLSVSRDELNSCEALSLYVLRKMQGNYITSVWSLACHVFMHLLWDNQMSISYDTLLRDVTALAQMAKALNGRIEGHESCEPLDYHLKRQLDVHAKLVFMDDQKMVHICPIKESSIDNLKNKSAGVLGDSYVVGWSILHLIMQYYINQSIHIFIRPALMEWILRRHPTQSTENLRSKVKILVTLFSQDFIFEKDAFDKDFEESLSFLVSMGCVCKTAGTVTYISKKEWLSSLLKPFIICYQGALHIAMEQSSWTNEKEFCSYLQSFLKETAISHKVYSCLSLDTCKHAFKSLVKLGVFNKSERYERDFQKLQMIQEILIDKIADAKL